MNRPEYLASGARRAVECDDSVYFIRAVIRVLRENSLLYNDFVLIVTLHADEITRLMADVLMCD